MLKPIKNALAYEHFVFIDCSNKSKHSRTILQFRGSFCKINGQIYRLRYNGEHIYFESMTVEQLNKESLKEHQLKIDMVSNEHIGLIIYESDCSCNHYEYIIPEEISDKIIVR